MKYPSLTNMQSLAVVGATGLVGKEFLEVLGEQKCLPLRTRVFASSRSQGEIISAGGQSFEVEALTEDSLEGSEVVFFSVPSEISKKYIPIALRTASVVVDDSAAFRLNPEVFLVVPHVNGQILRSFTSGLVATPNCVATPLASCLKPLEDKYGLERVIVSTYQSVSGAGRKAFDELSKQSIALLGGEDFELEVFPHRVAFNCLAQIGAALDSEPCEEELKVIGEVRKIMSLPELKIQVSSVRVPTFCGHGMTVNVDLEKDFKSIEEIRDLLDSTPGLKVLDKSSAHIYPTNTECIGSDDTFIGRVRRDLSADRGLTFWAIADNLRRGSAANAIEILDTIYRYRQLS